MAAERIEELLSELEGGEHATCSELVREVLTVHGVALGALMEIVAAERSIVERIAADPRVRDVLLLHGVHPRPPADRVRTALAKVEGIELQTVAMQAGELHVEVRCTGARQPGNALRERVEQAIADAAPELEAVRIDGLPPWMPVIPIALRSA